ncbi:MAG: hypothetical protein WAT17_02220 [Candidatus Saccharimonadales bacterium]|jgi:hypothetical protein
MIELNLLPDIKKEFIRAQRTRNKVIAGAILVTIIAGGLLALLATSVYGFQNVLIGSLRDDVKANQAKLAAKDEINKYLAIQSQLQFVDQVDAGRQQYARLFDYLLQLNPAPPSNVSLYSVALTDADTTMLIDGSAKTFEAVNNFRYTLQEAKLSYKHDGTEAQVPMFTQVTIDNPSVSNENGKQIAAFHITLVFTPEAFNATNTDFKIIVPKLITSNADQNTPKDLFIDQPAKETTDGNQ